MMHSHAPCLLPSRIPSCFYTPLEALILLFFFDYVYCN